MKLQPSTKIAIGFVAIAAVCHFGYTAITDRMIMGEKFTQLSPGRVNIVGVDPGLGYRIVVANYVAQLVQTSGDFEGVGGDGGGGATQGAIRKRLPLQNMIRTLQGDEKALGELIMTMNDIVESDDWPPVRVMWKAEDIRKALDGDKELEERLVRDLNVQLDGTPLSGVRLSSVENGIFIDSPVEVTVNLRGVPTKMVGRVIEPYKPRFIKTVEEQYANKMVTRDMQIGYYTDQAAKVLADPGLKEDVRRSLESRISKQRSRDRAVAPEQVLRSANVVINDSLITSASYREYEGTDGKPFFDLRVNLAEEGRRRLWQYSKKRVGTQLLLVVDGNAIAAPRISHDLSQRQFTITQMRDKVLLRDAVQAINEGKEVAKS